VYLYSIVEAMKQEILEAASTLQEETAGGKKMSEKRTAVAIAKLVALVSGKRLDLRDADLRDADLRDADLSYVDMRGADLSYADLRNADLRRAILLDADLYGANLIGAKTDEWVVNYQTVGVHPAPEGELTAWGKKNGHIVKMRIPVEAKRSCATTRKFRAEFAEVLEIEGADEVVVENEYGRTVYRPGEIVRCHRWDEDRWNECSGGIHFFLTRVEAETWEV
jgi:hypothetical protein